MDRRLELIGEMTPAIWVHLTAAIFAVVVGAFVIWRRKGTASHRFWGRAWAVSMLVIAGSSFFIGEIREGGFSPIHLLSVYTIFSIVMGVRAIRAGSVANHLRTMQYLYAQALLIAGGFTFLPQRWLGRMTFGETMPVLNYAIMAAMIGAGIWLSWKTWSRAAALAPR